MQKLVLSMGVSVDGLVARAGRYGAGGWRLPPEDAALTQRKLGWMDDIGLPLSRLGLVDEYRLILQPVVLGQGLPLFKDLMAPLRLELVDAQTYTTGAALHVYRSATAAA